MTLILPVLDYKVPVVIGDHLHLVICFAQVYPMRVLIEKGLAKLGLRCYLEKYHFCNSFKVFCKKFNLDKTLDDFMKYCIEFVRP